MEFTLVYQGPLKATAKPEHKQVLRRAFHKQLKVLWTQPPLNMYGPPKGRFLEDLRDNAAKSEISIIQKVGGFRFAPLVTERLYLTAELDITLLKPEPPGSIITQGGDIDNRLKTLLDSLRMPKALNEISSGDSPGEGENPFFCLLEDDNLITKVSVATHHLLERCGDSSYVNLMIHVKTKATRFAWNI